MYEMKRALASVPSIDLANLLKSDYEIFGEDVRRHFPQIADGIIEKRKIILEILMKREENQLWNILDYI